MEGASAKRPRIALPLGDGGGAMIFLLAANERKGGNSAVCLKHRNRGAITRTSLSSFSNYGRKTVAHSLLESKGFGPKLGKSTQLRFPFSALSYILWPC